MAAENAFSGPLPSDLDRSDLRTLIDRSVEDDDQKTGTPHDELHAMIDVSFRYTARFKEILKKHLEKMIIVQYDLITPQNATVQGVLFNSFTQSMRIQHAQFKGFKEDLSDMTEPWQAAMHDVLAPINDPKRGWIE